MFLLYSLRTFPTPVIVPPVPTEAMKKSRSGIS